MFFLFSNDCSVYSSAGAMYIQIIFVHFSKKKEGEPDWIDSFARILNISAKLAYSDFGPFILGWEREFIQATC